MDLLFLAEFTVGQKLSLVFAGAIVGFLVAAAALWALQHRRRGRIEQENETLRRAAQAEADKIVAQAEAEAKSQFIKRREEFDADTKSSRRDLRDEEKRLSKREDLVDQKLETLNTKERTLETAQKAVVEKEKALAGKDRQLNEVIAHQKSQLLKVANLSMEEARRLLLSQVEKDMERETAGLIARCLAEAKETAEAQGREDTVAAEETLRAGFNADVRPILRSVRKAKGVPADPLAAFRACGYEQRVAAERKQKRQDLGLGSTSSYA